MMLPDGDRAHVDRIKITEYLLSLRHPDGRGKAEFFLRFGFRIDEWQVLANALRTVGVSYSVVNVVESSHGARYTVDGPLQTPDGRVPNVRTVWILEPEGTGPRLVTAHPLKGK